MSEVISRRTAGRANSAQSLRFHPGVEILFQNWGGMDYKQDIFQTAIIEGDTKGAIRKLYHILMVTLISTFSLFGAER